jgi:ABC-type glycerol-3-phosphate transport system permease component
MMLPCWYLLVNSFKSLGDYSNNANVWGLPKPFYWDNWSNAFNFKVGANKAGVFTLYANSIIFTVVSVALNTIATVCVAYACARFDFVGKNLIVGIGIGALVFPDFGSASVIYRLYNILGWFDTWWVLTPKLNPFGLMFLILYSQFNTVSKTYAEAAKIDGASELRIFLQIMVPMVKGPVGMMMVMSAIGSWNDYYTPYMYFTSKPTLALGLFQLSTDTSQGADWPLIFAFITLCITPLMVFFVAMRDVIIENAAAGGIKG